MHTSGKEGVVVELEEGEEKEEFFFSVEILVASLERNSHQAQVQIFSSSSCKNKSFFFSSSAFPYDRAQLPFHCTD